MKNEKAKHTALPWRAVKTYPTDKSSYTVQAGANPAESVARVLWNGAQCEANAAFIAHACNNIERVEAVNKELLAVLKECELGMIHATSALANLCEVDKALALASIKEKARDAITKAERK